MLRRSLIILCSVLLAVPPWMISLAATPECAVGPRALNATASKTFELQGYGEVDAAASPFVESWARGYKVLFGGDITVDDLRLEADRAASAVGDSIKLTTPDGKTATLTIDEIVTRSNRDLVRDLTNHGAATSAVDSVRAQQLRASVVVGSVIRECREIVVAGFLLSTGSGTDTQTVFIPMGSNGGFIDSCFATCLSCAIGAIAGGIGGLLACFVGGVFTLGTACVLALIALAGTSISCAQCVTCIQDGISNGDPNNPNVAPDVDLCRALCGQWREDDLSEAYQAYFACETTACSTQWLAIIDQIRDERDQCRSCCTNLDQSFCDQFFEPPPPWVPPTPDPPDGADPCCEHAASEYSWEHGPWTPGPDVDGGEQIIQCDGLPWELCDVIIKTQQRTVTEWVTHYWIPGDDCGMFATCPDEGPIISRQYIEYQIVGTEYDCDGDPPCTPDPDICILPGLEIIFEQALQNGTKQTQVSIGATVRMVPGSRLKFVIDGRVVKTLSADDR